MDVVHKTELRQAASIPAKKGDHATLYINAETILNCELLSYSESGADISCNHELDFLNTAFQLTINLSCSGKNSTRKAEIKWIDPQSDAMNLGLEFIDHIGLNPKTHKLDINKIRIDPACALKLPAAIAIRRKLLPFLLVENIMHVAVAETSNPGMSASIERMLKTKVCLWPVEASGLNRILQQVYGNHAIQTNQNVDNKSATKLNDAVDIGDNLLYAAFVREASDIHIDPGHQQARIRFRVDGQLELYEHIKKDVYTELSSRIKVMAGLDIAEKRAPQDGRFTHILSGGSRRIDVRVATLPTKYGERITMRLLAVQTASLTLDKLGFSELNRNVIVNFLQRLQGMMILTGPTGSGKTTTLYAAIRMLLKNRQVNIITVEDPIEYEIEGVAQCEVDNASDKVDFAKALRSILRHDPDVVMIGEIRDKETADIAIKAALTGHMVFGTLHTNSAAASITRLIDMGVEPYLVAAALRLTVAQRLLRRLCAVCRIPRYLTELEAVAISRPELAGAEIFDPCGCVYCGNRGYAGRIGLYELLELREDWARAVADGKTETDIEHKMRQAGVNSLFEDAVEKLLAGETSYPEVVQIASSW